MMYFKCVFSGKKNLLLKFFLYKNQFILKDTYKITSIYTYIYKYYLNNLYLKSLFIIRKKIFFFFIKIILIRFLFLDFFFDSLILCIIICVSFLILIRKYLLIKLINPFYLDRNYYYYLLRTKIESISLSLFVFSVCFLDDGLLSKTTTIRNRFILFFIYVNLL